MRHLATCIEQLHLAAVQLTKVADPGLPFHARFALILTDNVIELLMHRFCMDQIAADLPTWRSSPKYDAKTRAGALGRYFDPKAKFCRAEGVITESELDFLRIGHDFRNELYHAGLAHDVFIYDVAWAYHDLACSLFGRWPVHWVTSDDKAFTGIVKLYVQATAMRVHPSMLGDKERADVAAALASAKPAARNRLGVALSAALVTRIEKIESALQFLVEDQFVYEGKTPLTEAETVVEVQFGAFLRSEDHPPPSKNAKTMADYHNEIRSGWTPKHPTSPTSRWKQRAKALAAEKDNSKALVKYTGLVADLEQFEADVDYAARDLDMGIQHAIDVARGK